MKKSNSITTSGPKGITVTKENSERVQCGLPIIIHDSNATAIEVPTHILTATDLENLYKFSQRFAVGVSVHADPNKNLSSEYGRSLVVRIAKRLF